MISTLELQTKAAGASATPALPPSHEPFTDTYFLRTKHILQKEGLNPFVRAQVFIRKGPGTIRGIDEAVAMLAAYTPLAKHGGRVYALPEGSTYGPRETVMVIEAPVQDIVELETMYLGVIAAETTKASEPGASIDRTRVTANTRAIKDLIGDRPLIYMGARHWRYDEDAAISAAAFAGGATDTSTDIGAATVGKRGVGTIPHALENITAYARGKDQAVVTATQAFDRAIDPHVPRIALIDYNNREIDDAVATADALQGRLYGVRIDTCGENVMQGAAAQHEKPYWGGTGVTVTGVKAVREALDATGHRDVKIILSSGFADHAKTSAFVEAERELGTRLFDALGVGGLYHSRAATMDIVGVGESIDTIAPLAKAGREYRPSERLELVLGGN